jgi:hypothetical protein
MKRSRDVIFDEDSLYNPENPFLPELEDEVPEFIEPQNIIELQEICEDVTQEEDEDEDIMMPTENSALVNPGKQLVQELE